MTTRDDLLMPFCTAKFFEDGDPSPWFCTLDKDHPGIHVAEGSEYDDRGPITWPQEEEQPS